LEAILALLATALATLGLYLVLPGARILKPKSPFSAIIPLVAIGVGGIILVAVDTRNIKAAFAQRQWPTANGVVIDRIIVGDRAIRPLVTYQYIIGGQSFTAESDLKVPGFGLRTVRRDTAETTLLGFSPGTAVTVFYNPDDPRDSHLRPGPTWNMLTRYAFGIVLFGSGLFGGLLICGKAPRREDAAV
jgi:hypothetical protein